MVCSELRKKLPDIPILCYTATCSVEDRDTIVENLGLSLIVQGSGKDSTQVVVVFFLTIVTSIEPVPYIGTVFFSNTVYRSNLRFQVLQQLSNSKSDYEIVKFILQYHEGKQGIIFCGTTEVNCLTLFQTYILPFSFSRMPKRWQTISPSIAVEKSNQGFIMQA